jgi:primosomal protein N' (replication factor Y) (superfamily II helicase)
VKRKSHPDGATEGGESLFAAAQPTRAAADWKGVRFVRVAVERGIGKGQAVDDALTYRDSVGDLKVGERVEVPLGKSNTTAFGLVVAGGGIELLDGYPPEKVKLVGTRLPGTLPADLVELAVWLAGYYVCPLGMVLAAMTPAAVKKQIGLRQRTLLNRVAANADANAKLAGAPASVVAAWEKIAALPSEMFPAEPVALIAEAGLKTRRAINELLKRGILVEVRVGVVDGGHAGKGSVQTLADTASAVVLNAEQQKIVDGVEPTLGSFSMHLIHGVTGSGKTEVYLRLINSAVKQGKSAIVLVPEIALTPQTAGRFLKRFERVAVLHSGLTSAQRHREWSRVSKGEVQVVVGARSAVFAPLTNLGIIVVDEEHDGGYKQDQLPRYHGRDVAIKRAQINACPVVLGSATPSLESWSNATRATVKDGVSGKPRAALWSLTKRATQSPLPRVQVVDLLEQRRIRLQAGDRTQRLLGPTLEAAIDGTLAAGGQVILLLNRRGYGRYISCTKGTCDFVLACDQCTATLVYHKDRELPAGGLVRCHHCLCEQLLPRLCPKCSSKVHIFGGGTQRAEDELERCFASHGIVRDETLLRVDADTTKTGRDWFNALDRFGRGEIKILLGTQMIAKGLDFPNVRLVGIIDADTAANLPDFRASERTFQLVSQVGGRAGRGETPGLVVVQTVAPHSRPIVLAAQHDYVTFANEELAARQRFALPPAVRMGRIVCRDLKAPKAEARAAELVAALTKAIGASGHVLGPSECPMFRIAKQYRYEVVATARTATILQAAFAQLRASGLLMSDSKTAVDVDPIAMM